VATVGSGLIQVRDGKFVTYTVRDGLLDNKVDTICRDKDGNLMVGTWSGL
jgi:ligand-binding sensor domain-containing protein